MKLLIASLLSFLISTNHACDISSYVVSVFYMPPDATEYNLICSASFLDSSFLITTYSEVYRMKSLSHPSMNIIPGYKVVVGVINNPNVKIETNIEKVYLAERGQLSNRVFGIIKLENPVDLPGLNHIEWVPLKDGNFIGRAQLLPRKHENETALENFVQLENTEIDAKTLSVWYPDVEYKEPYSISVTLNKDKRKKYVGVNGAPLFIGNKFMGFYTGTIYLTQVDAGRASSSNPPGALKYNVMDKLRNRIKCLLLPVNEMSDAFRTMLQINLSDSEK